MLDAVTEMALAPTAKMQLKTSGSSLRSVLQARLPHLY